MTCLNQLNLTRTRILIKFKKDVSFVQKKMGLIDSGMGFYLHDSSFTPIALATKLMLLV